MTELKERIEEAFEQRELLAQPEYADAVPHRNYRKENAMALVPGEVAKLEFDLLPTSYMLRKGYKMRVAIATADKDNFAQICAPGSEFELLRSDEHPSGVVLPVMPA